MTPPVTGADSTRERIVAAATAEFSRHGIAGARIERIAKSAKTSKERVYAHFSSKEALYAFVAKQELAAVAAATRLDPADLPGYAGRIHDYFTAHPERLRIMTWGQLELADGEPRDNPVRHSVAGKVEQLRRAQRAGLLDSGWNPLDILVLVNRIAMSWVEQPDLLPPAPAADRAADSTTDGANDAANGAGEREAFLAERRTAIVEAVQRLFPAAANTETGP
jgi:AcrR family transcriptional regulator